MKKLFALFLSVFLSLSLVVPAYADVATPSNADFYDVASSSNADYDSLFNADFVPYSSISTITNTVDYSDVLIALRYLDTSGNYTYVYAHPDSDGRFNISKPLNISRPISMYVYIYSGSLPRSGKYSTVVDVSSAVGYSYSASYSYYAKLNQNAAVQSSGFSISFVQNSGDFQFSGLLDLRSVSQLVFYTMFSSDSVFDGFTGQVKVNFTLSSDSGGTSVGPEVNSSDIQGDIANNTGAMVQGQNEIIDTLHGLIQHISDQLYAFWDQLAGEFTNMYGKWEVYYAGIIDALQDGLEANLNQNFDQLIENDNKNTSTVTNGYDSSGMNDDNDRLSDSLSEYDQAEKDVLDKVNDSLNSFEFSDAFGSHLSAFQVCAGFVQGLYDNAGAFKDVINLAFMFFIASLVIGIYRFKGD